MRLQSDRKTPSMTPSVAPSENKAAAHRIDILDIARGLAALAVVLFHYSVILPRFIPDAATIPVKFTYGFYGVHLFFVVSGFVILMTLERSNVRQFVISRLARLYPAYWLACLLTFGILTAFQPFPYAIGFGEFLVNLTMLQDFVKVPPIDGVYWSLSYELGFYAFMFALFGLRLQRFAAVLPFYMIAGAVLFHFAARHIPHPLHLLLMVNQYSHLFGCGLALYLLRTRGSSWLHWSAVAVTPLVQMLYDDMTGLVAGGIIAALMSAACLPRLDAPRAARPLLWLGSISYALYLVHQMLGFAALGWLQAQGWGPWAATLATVAGALLLAHAITYYFERPFSARMKRALRAIGTKEPASATV